MSRKAGILYIVVLVFILACIGLYFAGPIGGGSSAPSKTALTKDEIQGRALARDLNAVFARQGVAEAITKYESIVRSATATPAVTASTILAGAGLAYRVNRTTENANRAIRDLKKVTDPNNNVRPYVRSQGLLLLARWYEQSGRTRKVFDEIFSGAPYDTFIVRDATGQVDRLESVSRLIKYAYEISPSYPVAIAVANNQILQLYEDESYQKVEATKAVRIAQAEEYLAYAEDLVSKRHTIRTRDPGIGIGYLAMRAFVYGGLAHFKGESYRISYRRAYQDLFTYIDSARNTEGKGRLAQNHFLYAGFLLQVDNDSASAEIELKRVVEAAKVPAHDILITQVRKMKNTNYDTRAVPVSLETLEAVSPEFKEFVDGIN